LAVPTLTMTYEELTSNHRAAIRKLSAFLQVTARAKSTLLFVLFFFISNFAIEFSLMI